MVTRVNASKSETSMTKRSVDIRSDYNPGQNIWNKIEKSSKSGQKKKFDIYFCVFFNYYYQSLISERETGH